MAVKILRPDIARVIAHDVALLDAAAGLIEMLWPDGRRLKPREVVAEFDTYLHDELDLVREAANAAQLRRNMQGLNLVRRAAAAQHAGAEPGAGARDGLGAVPYRC